MSPRDTYEGRRLVRCARGGLVAVAVDIIERRATDDTRCGADHIDRVALGVEAAAAVVGSDGYIMRAHITQGRCPGDRACERVDCHPSRAGSEGVTYRVGVRV